MGFPADLSVLFETPSIWGALSEALILAIPAAIVIAGFATWRVGEKRGVMLMVWGFAYLTWMLLPWHPVAEIGLAARFVSVLGWFWLYGAWGRRMRWHDPLLIVAHGLVIALSIALFLILLVAVIRDVTGWDGMSALITGAAYA